MTGLEALAIPLLVSVIAALIVFIVKDSRSSNHKVRDEMNAHVATLRADISALSRTIAELRGAGEERAALVDLFMAARKL